MNDAEAVSVSWKLLAMTCLVTSLVSAAPTPASADFIDHIATSDDVGRAKVPAFGRSRVLVLTMEVDGFDPLDMDALRAYFSPDPTPGEPNFTDFYTRMSLGDYVPEAEVLDPIRFESCPLPEDYFGFEDCFIPRNGGGGAAALESLDVGLEVLETLIERADQELGVDFARYDINGIDGEPDGWIDGVLLVHNINFGGIALPVFFVRRDGPITVDGVQINIVGIAESPNVALHEFGHLLGWADLYDESRQTQGFQYSAMGSWLYETPPPAIDAYSRIAIGWTEPQVIAEGESVEGVRLPPATDTGAVVQLGQGDEYFLIENRGALPGDYIDAGIEGRGLSVVHVNLAKLPDPREGGWPLRLLNCLNCEPWSPFLMNEQADGNFSLQSTLGRRNDAEDLFMDGDDFLPNTINFLPLDVDNKAFSSNRYDGAVTGATLTNLRFEGDVAVFDVRVDEPCSIITCTGRRVCVEGRCVLSDEVPDETPDEEPPQEEAPEDVASSGGDGGCAVAQASLGADEPGSHGVLWVLLALGLFVATRRT